MIRSSQNSQALLVRAATWYCWLLTGFYLYSVNLQGNVVPFLQAEFALSYRAVSLHSSAIAVGIILVGSRVGVLVAFSAPNRHPLRRKMLSATGSRRGSGGGARCGSASAASPAAAPCSALRRRRGPASRPAS